MNKVQIPSKPPRNPDSFKDQIPFLRGLKARYFFAGFMGLGMFIPVLSLLVSGGTEALKPVLTPLIIALIIFGGIGAFIFRNTRKQHLRRMNAFENGKKVRGKVINQGRSAVFYSSWRDYTLTVAFQTEEGQDQNVVIKSRKPAFHSEFPLGTEIQGLWDETLKVAFFPAEIGVEWG